MASDQGGATQVGKDVLSIGSLGVLVHGVAQQVLPTEGEWLFVADFAVPAISALLYAGLRWIGAAFKPQSGEQYATRRRLNKALRVARSQRNRATTDNQCDILDSRIDELTEQLINSYL